MKTRFIQKFGENSKLFKLSNLENCNIRKSSKKNSIYLGKLGYW